MRVHVLALSHLIACSDPLASTCSDRSRRSRHEGACVPTRVPRPSLAPTVSQRARDESHARKDQQEGCWDQEQGSAAVAACAREEAERLGRNSRSEMSCCCFRRSTRVHDASHWDLVIGSEQKYTPHARHVLVVPRGLRQIPLSRASPSLVFQCLFVKGTRGAREERQERRARVLHQDRKSDSTARVAAARTVGRVSLSLCLSTGESQDPLSASAHSLLLSRPLD